MLKFACLIDPEDFGSERYMISVSDRRPMVRGHWGLTVRVRLKSVFGGGVYDWCYAGAYVKCYAKDYIRP